MLSLVFLSRKSKLFELADPFLLFTRIRWLLSPEFILSLSDMIPLLHGLSWTQSTSVVVLRVRLWHIHLWRGILLMWSSGFLSNTGLLWHVCLDTVLLCHDLLGDMILLWHGSPLTWPYWSFSSIVHLWYDPFLTWSTLVWAVSVLCCWPRRLSYSYSRKNTGLSSHLPHAAGRTYPMDGTR